MVKIIKDPLSVKAVADMIYGGRPCGICWRPGTEVYWPSSRGDMAHPDCYDRIAEAEARCVDVIKAVFKENGERNIAHAVAVKAVEKQCGGQSFAQCMETSKGMKKLTDLFNTVGVDAVLKEHEKQEAESEKTAFDLFQEAKGSGRL